MGSNGHGIARRRSVVTITGTRPSGEVVVQDLSLDHESSVSDDQLIGQAIGFLRQAGGIIVNNPTGSIDLYPVPSLTQVNFKVKGVVLANRLQ